MTPAPERTSARRLLHGWGRTARSAADLIEPGRVDEAEAAIRDGHPRGVLARGLGRSYGDAAQNAGGVVLSTTRMDQLLDAELGDGTVRVGAGMSLERLLQELLPHGWFPSVVPGTASVTIGGAIAADIHGKNHHLDGAFTRHVESLTLAAPDGTHVLAPGDPAFQATAGGMGLTGVVTEATLRLRRVETAAIRSEEVRTRDLDDLLARMEADDADHRYSVAWVDSMARGVSFGRGVLGRGDHATVDQLPVEQRSTPLRHVPPRRLPFMSLPLNAITPATVRTFNEAWFRKAPARPAVSIGPLERFFFPLDAVVDWNRVYGRRGFVQYQYVVPFEADDVLRRTLGELSDRQLPVFLAVLKRFGPAGDGHLSFPRPGWTLAVDLPAATPELARMLDRWDEWVAEAGGRVYLAKDARLRPELLAAMYPRLDEWRAVRDGLDPHGRLRSDLDRRLDLTGRTA